MVCPLLFHEPVSVIKTEAAYGFAEGVISGYAGDTLGTNMEGKLFEKLGEVTQYQLSNNWHQ